MFHPLYLSCFSLSFLYPFLHASPMDFPLFTSPLSTPSSPVTCPACPPPLPHCLHLSHLLLSPSLPPSIRQFFISAALTFCLLITSPSFPSLISAFIPPSILHAPSRCPPPLIYPFNISFLSRPDPSVTSSQPHLLIFYSPPALVAASAVLAVKYHCPAIPLSLPPPPLISTSPLS